MGFKRWQNVKKEHAGSRHDFLFWSFRDKFALRKGDWKIVRNRSKDAVELYNLNEDMSETTNLADEQAERLQSLLNFW